MDGRRTLMVVGLLVGLASSCDDEPAPCERDLDCFVAQDGRSGRWYCIAESEAFVSFYREQARDCAELPDAADDAEHQRCDALYGKLLESLVMCARTGVCDLHPLGCPE